MINSNEIRIGNWFKHNGEWCRKWEEEPDVNHFFQWSDEDWRMLSECTLDIENVSPIQITDDILSKSNLEKVEFFYQIHGGRYVITPMANGYYGIWLSNIDSLPDTMEFMTAVKYVHELQNIYFVLAHKELELNL
jgi:hypothetical protein